MRERKMIKRFGAAFTAFAVVSSLGSIAAFADDDVMPDVSIEITQDDVTSVEDAAQADVKKILPEEEENVQEPIAQTAEAGQVVLQDAKATIPADGNVFKIVVPYSGVPSGAQTTWMAYKADTAETPLGNLTIEYVNQDVTASTVTFYVKSKAAAVNADNIKDEGKVVIKVGGTNSVAAAKVVDLATAEIVTAPDVMPGDLNGSTDIDTQDGQILLRGISGTAELTEDQLAAGDVNGNGEIDPNDGQQLLKKISDPNYEFVAM